MNIDLSDRTVLVTGASRGIGGAVARSLAEAGATIAVHYGQSQKAAEQVAEDCGNGARPFQADFSDLESTDQLVPLVEEALGPLDGLVLNAGVALATPLQTDTDVWHDRWTETMNVNLRASELLCRHALRSFRDTGGGRLVSVASRAAFRGDTPDYMTYAASKAGLVALTRSIARGFGTENIKAFTVAPGFVRTDMAQDFIDEYGEEHVTGDLALEDLTEPDDVAPLVTFLMSGKADHATGTVIDVNAGSYVH